MSHKPETLAEYERVVLDVREWLMEHHADDDIGIDLFAVTMMYSVRSVQRALNYHGTNWRRELTRFRIAAASTLLSEHFEIPVQNISKAVGYKTHAQFSQAFKQQYDMTPREYRQVSRARKARR